MSDPSLIGLIVPAIRQEIEACEEECGLVAGSNTAYWQGAADALKWVLGEGDAPSSSDNEEGDDDE